jgi:hypothetical protein
VRVIGVDWLQIESNLGLGIELFLKGTFRIHYYLQCYLELVMVSHSNYPQAI